jgi:quercetin dioxygenase-like cupin family protein/uncharacterized protein (DUF2249 family)
MERNKKKTKMVDARELPAFERHERFIQIFKKMQSGEELQIISDHEPLYLIDQIRHEGLVFLESEYTSSERPDGSYITTLVKGEDGGLFEGVKITSIDKERKYSKDRFSPVGIYSADSYKVILTYIRAGQCIPVHSPSVDLIFAVIKGTGIATVGNGKVQLGPGSIVIVPRGERRGIVAVTDIEGIHIVSPVPNEEDHKVVEEKIRKGECS